MALPSPGFDHWAAFEAEVGRDGRLNAEQKSLLTQSARRLRPKYLDRSDLLQMQIVNILRAQVEILVPASEKRLKAIEVFNKTADQANRLARRSREPGIGGERREGGTPPPVRTFPPRQEPVDAPTALIESPDGVKANLEDRQEQAGESPAGVEDDAADAADGGSDGVA